MRHFIQQPVVFLLASFLCLTNVCAEDYVIRNATVHTQGEMGTVKNASLVISDGRITAIGKSVDVPPGATVINGEGKVVTPGIFDALSSLGITEVGYVNGEFENEATLKYGPAFAVIDSFNPRAEVINVNRIEGVTRGLIVPSPSIEGHVIAGTASLVVYSGDDKSVIERDAAMVAYLGITGQTLVEGSRSIATLKLKEALADALEYHRNRDDYNSGNSRELSLGKSDLEALKPVIDGDMPLMVYVDRASDIEALLDLASAYDFRTVVLGGAEAWMVADKLAAAEVGVILDPTTNLPGDFDSINSTLGNAVKLHEAGVEIGFYQGDSHNARNLTQLAGNAVANGLPWRVALEAITGSPARMISGDTDCCTIEPGHAAELVVWDGDPLEVTTFATQVFINGKSIPMTSRQTKLRDRYLDLKDKQPFAYRH